MDSERARTTIEVWWLRWSGRLRTVGRAAGVAGVALGGFNLVFADVAGGALLTGYRGPIVELTPVGVGVLADLILVAVGLVTVLLLSVFPRS